MSIGISVVLIIVLLCSILLFSKGKMNSFSNCKNKEFNLNPDIWGPPTWIFLHSLAFGYPKNPTKAVKYETKKLLESLKYNLPCEECQIHYSNNLKKLPVQLNSQEEFFNWTIDLHNIVNIQLGKPVIAKKEVLEYYHKIYLS